MIFPFSFEPPFEFLWAPSLCAQCQVRFPCVCRLLFTLFQWFWTSCKSLAENTPRNHSNYASYINQFFFRSHFSCLGPCSYLFFHHPFAVVRTFGPLGRVPILDSHRRSHQWMDNLEFDSGHGACRQEICRSTSSSWELLRQNNSKNLGFLGKSELDVQLFFLKFYFWRRLFIFFVVDPIFCFFICFFARCRFLVFAEHVFVVIFNLTFEHHPPLSDL